MIGDKLRMLRKSHNLTMKDFGAIFSLAESTISGYENSTRNPDIDTLIKIADFFNVSLDWLLGRNGATCINAIPEELQPIANFYNWSKADQEELISYLKIKEILRGKQTDK